MTTYEYLQWIAQQFAENGQNLQYNRGRTQVSFYFPKFFQGSKKINISYGELDQWHQTLTMPEQLEKYLK